MIIRTKNGDVGIRSRVDLLDFLSGVTGKGGEVKDDISIIADVQLAVSREQLAVAEKGKDDSATGDNSADNSSGVSVVNSVSWCFSTFDLDRYDERVDPAGWELEHFKRNPVIQWAHLFHIPAIGYADNLRCDAEGLRGDIVFNGKEFDPFGWAIGERVKAGVLRAGSVGFRVLEVELPGKKAAEDGTALIFRRQELLEFSICNVPANPFALTQYQAGKQAKCEKVISEQCTGNSEQCALDMEAAIEKEKLALGQLGEPCGGFSSLSWLGFGN
jgi:HK97 family phage prohead protease